MSRPLRFFLTILSFLAGAFLLAVAYTFTGGASLANVILILGIILFFGSILYAFVKVLQKIFN
jgi:hypothetical protein